MGNPKQLRIGMIGAGRMALWHLRAYRCIPGVKVVAIANPHSGRGADLQRRFGIAQRFECGEDLIAQAEVDAVVICIPTAQHALHANAALRRGLHVYCEKPLTASVAETRELVDLEKTSGRVLFNGFNYRWMPEYREIAARLRGGEIGEVRYMRMFRATQEAPDSYMLGREHAGVLIEFQCHFVDLLEAFGMGDPVCVRAMGTTVGDWALRPDTVTTQLTFADGVLAEITTCSATPGLAATLLVVGTRGTLTLTAGRVRVVRARARWTLAQRLGLLWRESWVCPHRVLRNPFSGACRHFVSCVRGDAVNHAGAEAALRVQTVLEMAQRNLVLAGPIGGSGGCENFRVQEGLDQGRALGSIQAS